MTSNYGKAAEAAVLSEVPELVQFELHALMESRRATEKTPITGFIPGGFI